MGSLGTWLMAAVGPLAIRVLAALGIGWVTYETVGVLAQSVVTSAQAAWGGMVGPVVGMANLLGLSEAMGIMCGALVARVALVSSRAVLGRLNGGA